MSHLDEIRRAEARIRESARETPLVHSQPLSDELGCDVLLKCEHLQETGSFKVRGALNKVLSLREAGELPPIVAASTGNHGAAVAFAARAVDSRATVYVPTNANPRKLELMRELDAEIRMHGADCLESEQEARRWSREVGACYVSPYNDPEIVAGQGTLALEILRHEPELAAIFVALGGGGLLSGVSIAMRASSPKTRIFGCSPEPSAVMVRSVAAGRILEIPSYPTLSDGTAGGVERDSITFPILQELVSDFVIVPEPRTRRAFQDYLARNEEPIEGAAAMTLAACRMQAEEFRGGRVAVVLCGGNVTPELLDELRG